MKFSYVIPAFMTIPRSIGIISLLSGTVLTISSQWLKAVLLEWDKYTAQFFALFSLELEPIESSVVAVSILMLPIYVAGIVKRDAIIFDRVMSAVFAFALLIFAGAIVTHGMGVIPSMIEGVVSESLINSPKGFSLFFVGGLLVFGTTISRQATFITFGGLAMFILIDRLTVFSNAVAP